MGSPLGPSGYTTSGVPGILTGNNGSLPGMVDNTQAKVTADYQAQTQQSTGWNGASSNFFGGILGGFSNATGLGNFLIDSFLASLCDAITGATGGLINLSGWASSLRADATSALTGTSTISEGVSNNITGATATTTPAGVGPAVQLLNATVQAAGNTPQVDIFNQDGTWDAPPGGTVVDLKLIGASGGSAQGGMGTTGAAGGAGGAGGYSVWYSITMSSLPSSVAVDVGVGGTGGQNAINAYTDDFNRADNAGGLGSNWRTDSGTAAAQILNGAAECGPMGGSSGENGRWMTWNGGNLLSDNYIVQAQLVTPSNAEATDNYTGIMVAVPNTYGSGSIVVAFVGNTSSGCGLITQTGAPASPYVANGAGSGQAIVANSTTPFTNTSLITLSRVGNVFTGSIDGTPVVTWTDTANTVLTGASNRKWGFITEGNWPAFQHQYDSPAIDWISGRDLGVHSQPGTAGGNTSFNGSAYQATGGTGGVGGGIDASGTRRPASGSFLNTDTAWNGAQGTGNQPSINPAGGIGAAGQTGYTPNGAPGGDGYNTAGGAAGTASSVNGAAGTSAAGGVYGPGSGGGGGFWKAGVLAVAGQGGAGGFPGGAPGGGGANTDGQGTNGAGNAGSDGQAIVTTHF